MQTGRRCLVALLASLLAATCLPAAAPDESSDPFLSGATIIPAGSTDEAGPESAVQTAEITDETAPASPGSPDYLFPDGRPQPPPELTYPDGTVPIQYPLDDNAYRGLPDAYPGSSSGWAPPPTPMRQPSLPADPPVGVVGWKTVKGSLTELFGSSDSFGMASVDLRGTLEFGRLPGVFVTPQFGWHLLTGPSATDMPPQLYDFTVDFSMYRPVGDQWLLNLSLTPSLFTDGENLSGDALRVLGRAMAYYTASPTVQWAGGIVYLDRTDLPVLPAIGAVFTPREDLRFELLFPKPRLAWRQWYSPLEEQWVYATGELGGQSWGVVRASGADDIATYRDLRLVLGLERKQSTGRSWFVEGGYVFGREIEYESNVGGATFNDTGFVRVGGTF